MAEQETRGPDGASQQGSSGGHGLAAKIAVPAVAAAVGAGAYVVKKRRSRRDAPDQEEVAKRANPARSRPAPERRRTASTGPEDGRAPDDLAGALRDVAVDVALTIADAAKRSGTRR